MSAPTKTLLIDGVHGDGRGPAARALVVDPDVFAGNDGQIRQAMSENFIRHDSCEGMSRVPSLSPVKALA
jgi:hypothetical protein